MKLAASQIGWDKQDAPVVLQTLRDCGFAGLEIAPTIAVGENPYDAVPAAAAYARDVKERYALALCSMQSIWYGQQGSMFGPQRSFLLEYTKKAILFAQAAGIGNLVFGCPKNRVLPEGVAPKAAVPFFEELGAFAAAHGTVLALEANPAMYGTNFINGTAQAFKMVHMVASPGFMVNLDFGTMLQNEEPVEMLAGRLAMVNHVHISEPGLQPVRPRKAHQQLAALLHTEGYEGYVSIEQKQQPAEAVGPVAQYVAEVFA